MWYEKLDNEECLRLICDTFTWDELWEGAAELNQLCAAREMDKKIPRNVDKGDQRDRVKILATAVIGSLKELKEKADSPVFVVSSEQLFSVPGVLKDTVKPEPAVTTRLDNIEKAMADVTKALSELKAARVEQFPALQVNGSSAAAQTGSQVCSSINNGKSTGQDNNRNKAFPGFNGRSNRSVSPSVKRKAGQDEGGTSQRDNEAPWTDVVKNNRGRRPRPPRPVQQGTARVTMEGSEAAPFNVVIANTHPDSTEDIIKEVLIKVAESMPDEHKLDERLEILEAECLTKPRDDGKRVWSKTWRIQVPNKFQVHMMKPEAVPAGWMSRKYFPPRDPRPSKPPVPALDPMQDQPPGKRANLDIPNQF